MACRPHHLLRTDLGPALNTDDPPDMGRLTVGAGRYRAEQCPRRPASRRSSCAPSANGAVGPQRRLPDSDPLWALDPALSGTWVMRCCRGGLTRMAHPVALGAVDLAAYGPVARSPAGCRGEWSSRVGRASMTKTKFQCAVVAVAVIALLGSGACTSDPGSSDTSSGPTTEASVSPPASSSSSVSTRSSSTAVVSSSPSTSPAPTSSSSSSAPHSTPPTSSTSHATTKTSASIAPLPPGLTAEQKVEAFAGVEVYRKYMGLLDTAYATPGKDWSKPAAAVLVLPMKEQLLANLAAVAKGGQHWTGKSVVYPRVTKVDHGDVTVKACVDRTKLDFLDRDGKSIRLPDEKGAYWTFPMTVIVTQFGKSWLIRSVVGDLDSRCVAG